MEYGWNMGDYLDPKKNGKDDNENSLPVFQEKL
jgi:hypothetical protein